MLSSAAPRSPPASAIARPGAPPRRPHYLPGLLLTAAIAALSTWLGGLPWPQRHGLGPLTLAIALGVLAGNTLYPHMAHRAGAGVGFARHWLLRIGIVLYGLRLTLQDIGQVGAAGVLIDALVLASTFVLAGRLGPRLFGLDRTTSLLIGAGSSICGAAAVMAAEPVLRARAEQAAVAIATVVVFGTLAMFLYPALYRLGLRHGVLPLDEHAFGVFVGSTVHEVAQAVAAGRAIGGQAADSAVIAKMVRVMMLAPALVLLSALLARRAPTAQGGRPAPVAVPWFAFGFVAVAGFHSLHWLPAPLVAHAVALDSALLAMAMAALGLGTQASALRRAGPRPLLLALLLSGWLLGGGLAINLGVQALL
ncbi:YeiH family protein [Flavobacterium sp. MXW15]|uniref:YeiH family protein n=1 Tax=Xanthomonas chitinilytica TaxID=2989819 RepID=A0ABT3K063_9XANT|nr:YeiH family protein [Xanthomonas sp. H13-6]MCW4454022.1 YeiH family protein [Flavobacterium sp. MXW15]MCW4473810.1 YeiH family protein [Xanthomonas sp. H13-6]